MLKRSIVRSKTVLRVLGVAGLITLAGCTSAGGKSTPQNVVPTPAAAVPTQASGAAGSGEAVSTTAIAPEPLTADSVATTDSPVLVRRDAPPEGVPEQLAYRGGGGPGDCTAGWADGSGPQIVPAPGIFEGTEIGMGLYVCFLGFAPGSPIEVQLTRADGSQLVESLKVNADGSAGWESGLPVGSPLGDYKIVGQQGNLTAELILPVKLASFPHVFLTPRAGPQGTLFEAGLAGIEPRTALTVHIYRQASGDSLARYATSVAVQTDARGEAVLALPTSRQTPVGEYILSGDKITPISLQVGPALRSDLPAGASPLEREDSPPEGVDPIYPGGVCWPTEATAVTLWSASLEIGERETICVTGFAPDSSVQLTVVAPDGQARSQQVATDRDGTAQLVWIGLPGKPFGGYTLAASQDAIEAQGAFTLSAAESPSIGIVQQWVVAGEPVQAMIMGYAPGQTVGLHLYRDSGMIGDYVRSFQVQVDKRGEAMWTLPTSVEDLAGRYSLVELAKATADQDAYAVESAGFVLASAPIVISPTVGTRGTEFVVELTGFAPFESIALNVSRQEESGAWSPVNQITARVNGDGTAVLTVYTTQEDKPGAYAVSAGKPAEGAVFSLE